MTTEKAGMPRKTKKQEPLKPCPAKDVINVMQFQFFDNGPSKVKGAVQYTMKLEAYCGGRLNLHAPYWRRTVQLISPKLVLKWADKKLAEGLMTADQHRIYQTAYDHTLEVAQNPDIEWVKMGHIGSKRENKYYVGQFIYVSRELSGPMECAVLLDGEVLAAGAFIHDQHSKPGSGRRKAYSFYDPSDMYGAMKREQAMRAEAESRALGGE